jgi:diguanylate cyclase (GGDEF)-like protein
LILLVVFIQIQGLWQTRHQSEERARLTARDLGNVLAANIVGAFRNIDLVLLAAIDQIHLRPPGAGAPAAILIDALDDLHRRTPGLIGLHVTDASGTVVYGTGREFAKNLSIADRDYFQKLKANPDSGMVVSSPVLGKIEQKWVLVCARRIDLPDGQFGGVIYGSIEIEGMAERITGTPLQLGEQDIVAVSENDMTLIVRYLNQHQDMRFVGQRRSVPAVDELLRSGAEEGFFTSNSPFDQVERIFYFQRIAGQPMNLIVGLAAANAMSGWRRETAYAGITIFIFTLITSFASYLIYQGQLRTLRLVAELAESNQRLSELSTTDGLTGIANRRRFDELLAEEWRRGIRNRQSLALAMVDVDFFKPYNDRYGHQSGDECLRQIAQVLSQHVRRAGDFVARYGGEEFVVICVALDGEHARHLVEGIRASVEKLALPHELSEFGHVTASIGVSAIVPGEGQDPEILIRTADQALYAAKEQGRNRVVLAP